MDKHTPGPWKVEPSFDRLATPGQPEDYKILADAGGYHQEIARVWFCGGGGVVHNACLISTAPQLLEACKLAEETLRVNGEHKALWVVLRRAIEAAEGES